MFIHLHLLDKINLCFAIHFIMGSVGGINWRNLKQSSDHAFSKLSPGQQEGLCSLIAQFCKLLLQ